MPVVPTPREALDRTRDAMDRFANLASVGEHEVAYERLQEARYWLRKAEVAWVVTMRDDGVSWQGVADIIGRSQTTAIERYHEDVQDYLVDRARGDA